MDWIVCPKISLSFDVKVTAADCLKCAECEKAFDVWVNQLRVLPNVDEQAMRDKKERRRGRCAKARDSETYCSADLTYCKYNHICSDEHPRKKIMLAVKEVSMFLGMNKEGNIVSLKGDNINKIELLEDTSKVLQVRKQIVKVRTLVPLKKESDLKAPALPANLASVKNVLVNREDGIVPIPIKEFIEGDYDCAMLVEKTYVPKTTFRVEMIKPASKPAPNKQAPAPKRKK